MSTPDSFESLLKELTELKSTAISSMASSRHSRKSPKITIPNAAVAKKTPAIPKAGGRRRTVKRIRK